MAIGEAYKTHDITVFNTPEGQWIQVKSQALTPYGLSDFKRQVDQVLDFLARQRITKAQDTVDQIRSDNALRSDFV